MNLHLDANLARAAEAAFVVGIADDSGGIWATVYGATPDGVRRRAEALIGQAITAQRPDDVFLTTLASELADIAQRLRSIPIPGLHPHAVADILERLRLRCLAQARATLAPAADNPSVNAAVPRPE